jgi:hypothetical protein
MTFLEAPFWSGKKPTSFRYAWIVSDPENAAQWKDERGEHPIRSGERNLAYLSRHDDEVSHRVVIFSEDDFVAILKAWILCLRTFPAESRFSFKEAAE